LLAERTEGFETKTRKYLNAIALAMAPALQAVVEKEISRSLLQAYLGRRVADRVLNGTIRRGTGEMIDAVVWISDLRDFTRLSETLSSSQLIMALNDCCARLVGAIQPFGREVLKFIGDGLLAIFPVAPKGEGAACNAALSAVRAARDGMARLDRERLNMNLPPLPFGVGLHLGPVVYGNIGAPDRLDFTAIGPAVNVGSRIMQGARMPGANIAGGSDALYDPAGKGGKLSSTRQRQSRRALYFSRDGVEIKRRLA
jgi:adenylate cyclase